MVLIWQVLFHYNGVVNDFLGHFGFQAIDWLKSEQGKIVLVLLFLWKNLGYNMILFMAALGNIPQDIIEVATLDTSSRAQIFFPDQTALPVADASVCDDFFADKFFQSVP